MTTNGEGTKLPPLNEKLIACVLEHIKQHPEEWEQGTWLDINGCRQDNWCGTVGCFAGWAVALSTPESQWPPDTYYIRDRAAELLGITPNEAMLLFRASNTMGRLREYLNQFRKARQVPDGQQKKSP